jgi:hypothetical protein
MYREKVTRNVGIRFQFLAQFHDVGVDGACIWKRLVSPDRVQDHVTGQRAVWILQKVSKQIVFCRSEFQLFPTSAHDSALEVDLTGATGAFIVRRYETDTGAAVLVRLQRPSAVPLESLHAKKDDLGRTVRVTAAGVLPRRTAGEFTLRPQQGDVRAIFLSLSRLQRELEVPGRANTIVAALRASDGGTPALPEARTAAVATLVQGLRSGATLEDGCACAP